MATQISSNLAAARGKTPSNTVAARGQSLNLTAVRGHE